MNELKDINEKLGKWIQILDYDNNDVTIENFDFSLGVHGVVTVKHCAKCVATNKCWFINEKGKKPEPFRLIGIEWLDDFMNELSPYLYHYKCHCYETPIVTPTIDDIHLIVPKGKIDWLIKDKMEWVKALGYDNAYEFADILLNLIKEAYCKGNYLIVNHDKFGVKINLFCLINGNNNKKERLYAIKSSFMVFPNGKLKCNTLLGGWQK